MDEKLHTVILGLQEEAIDKESKITGWWFQTFFDFHPYLGKWSNLTNIFRWVETTNQINPPVQWDVTGVFFSKLPCKWSVWVVERLKVFPGSNWTCFGYFCSSRLAVGFVVNVGNVCKQHTRHRSYGCVILSNQLHDQSPETLHCFLKNIVFRQWLETRLNINGPNIWVDQSFDALPRMIFASLAGARNEVWFLVFSWMFWSSKGLRECRDTI